MFHLRMYVVITLCGLLFMLTGKAADAQETEQSITYAEKYLDARTSDLSKYLNHSGKLQQRLLRRLQRKEAKIARKLAAKDSALYRQYMHERLSYDSIARLQQDTASLRERFASKRMPRSIASKVYSLLSVSKAISSRVLTTWQEKPVPIFLTPVN